MADRSFKTLFHAGVAALLLAISLASPAHAYSLKVSKAGNTHPGCSSNESAVVKVAPTDASRALLGDAQTKVTGDSGFTANSSVSSNAMYLSCTTNMGTYIVNTEHSAITFSTDGNNVTSFPQTTISKYDTADIAAINPSIDTSAVWCSLFIPEDAGCLWEIPSGVQLDRVKPRIDGGRLVTNTMVGFSNGQSYWTWDYFDSGTPILDPDGANGNSCPGCSGAGCWTCNKSASGYQWQIFRRQDPAPYTGAAVGSTSAELYYITDADQTTTRDRMISSPDTFCYSLRIQDSAGNWSVESADLNSTTVQEAIDTRLQEKCIRTDGKAPAINNVEYFTTYDPVLGFSDQFPFDFLGNPIVTTNPCRFSPTCDLTVDRYIEIKLTFSEPLFDSRTPLGYTVPRSDNYDNDNDGAIDEETGGFNGLDDDSDGEVDEDVAFSTATYALANNDLKDNDGDGYVDEEPNGTDTKDNDDDSSTDEDTTSRTCDADQMFNRAQSVNSNTVCYDRPEIFIDGIDSEGKVTGGKLEYICTQDGTTTNPDCAGLAYGETVYRYKWKVGRASPGDVPPVGLETGQYDITISGMDAVGNSAVKVSPIVGGSVWVDNSAPFLTAKFFKDSSFVTTFFTANHDNNSSTPVMPVVKDGNVYISISSYEDEAMTASEPLGASPSVYVFMPDAQVPAYNGTPQASNMYPITAYTACGQNSNCNFCTGANCVEYDADTTPCDTFKACFTVDSSTMNDGYAAITVDYVDRFENRYWHSTDAQAAADQNDIDKKSDDTGSDGKPAGAPGNTSDSYEGDGIPTFFSIGSSSSIETDIDMVTSQYFAIDTTIPATPAISFPITPCNGQVARANGFCTDTATPVNSPKISWTSLLNGLDDDGDGSTDEECVDGANDDGDGYIDEDGKLCGGNDTANWEIGRWNLQVATAPSFASATIIKNIQVVGSSYNMPSLPERSATAPYYWRVAPYDFANNMGPYNPASPLVSGGDYFSFFVDVSPPAITKVEYYTDKDCTVPMQLNALGYPVTTDTQSNLSTMVCLKIRTDEPVPWATTPTSLPLVSTYQNNVLVEATSSVAIGATTTYFMTMFEVDAKGVGLEYQDGKVDLKITTRDVYGNKVTLGSPIDGAIFYVDSMPTQCAFSPVNPDPASMDNNKNGIPGEPTDDGATVTFSCNKYLGSSIKVRVIQNNFSSAPSMNDGLDNDCDGLIDEESSSATDDDGDNLFGEDTGSFGEQEGSGCYFNTTFEQGSQYTYSGVYDVVPTYYDGVATVWLGDLDTNSRYYATDPIGTPIFATTTFTIDTVGPPAPSLSLPIQSQVLNESLPQFRWTQSRVSDLHSFKIEIATDTAFTNIAATADILDDGTSSVFYFDISVFDIAECMANYPNPIDCPGLSDNTYYWRVYALDLAGNRSNSSLKFSFVVDTQPPAAPVFDDVTTPTTEGSSPLTGYTNPAEKAGSKVNIFVTGNSGVPKYVGFVTVDALGKFVVEIDDDKDGRFEEDPIDGADNDHDLLTDEDPEGIFLTEGNNYIEGVVEDTGGNQGTRGCAVATPFYDTAIGKCNIVLDSGAPQFDIVYYSDAALTQVLRVIDLNTNKQTAKAGTVYMKIRATEPLQSSPTFTVDQQGLIDVQTTSTTPIGASGTFFFGQFTVNQEMIPNYVDGDAKIYVIGTDLQGNQTEANTLPNSGGLLAIDTKTPEFRVTYWYDAAMREKPPKSLTLPMLIKPGSVFLRIVSSEPLASAPQVNIDHPGSQDLSGGVSTALDSTALLYQYEYTVTTADGSSYIDGTANVTINATDKAGNIKTDVVPIQGSTFIIDTTPPRPPTLVLPCNTTGFNQINLSGNVVSLTGSAEPYADVEIYVKLNLDMSPDDLVDNDGDNRADEEPGGVDGIDNDNDNFIDEDISANTCNTSYIWDPNFQTCITAVDNSRTFDGFAVTSETGAFSNAIVTGLMPTISHLFARATDMAGNTSDFSDAYPIAVKIGVIEDFSHTFPAGWNMVGVPFLPAAPTPATAFKITDSVPYQFKDGKYYYGVGMDPMAPGMCYWIYFFDEKNITTRGITSTTNVVNLQKGWNLVSLPYNFPTSWNNTVKIKGSAGTYAVGSADGDKIMDPYIYTYNGSIEPVGYSKIGINELFTIQPWEGFAVDAHEDSQLIFPDLFDVGGSNSCGL